MVALAPEKPAAPLVVDRKPPKQHVLLPLIARRILVMIPTLFGIVTITFILTHALGGNPARQIAGQAADPATIAKISHEYGFDKSLIAQYGTYLNDLIHGNLGISTVTNETVVHDLVARFPATLEMVILSIVVAVVIGVPLGAYAGRTQRRWAQNSIRTGTFVLLAVPDFWLALVLAFFLFFKLGWLPAPTGQVGLSGPAPNNVTGASLLDSVLTGNGPAFGDAFSHAILPIGVLGVLLSAPITRLMRGAMLVSMESDFMRFGTSVGLSRWRLWRYAVRGAIPTVITYTGTLFVLLCGGAVVMEQVFSWGGAAQYAAQAIGRNDFNATQGFVLVCGILAMVAFLVIDLIQLKVDPRIRTASTGQGLKAILIWRSKAAAVSPIPVPSAVTGAADERTESDVALLPEPVKTKREFGSGIIDVFQVCKEIVLDIRPHRWPAAIWRTIRSGNVPLLIGSLIIIVMVAAAFIVPPLWKYQVLAPDPLNPLVGPSSAHPFGTDNSGFDVFIRVIDAARTDLWIAAAGIFLSAFVGVLLGLLLGFSRKRVIDDIVMRIVDMIQSFPVLIVAIALVAFAGNSLTNVIWALCFINIPIFLRVARGQVLTVREMRYIEAAQAMGNSRFRILVRHVLPNIIGQAIVQVGIQLGYALLTVAGLAFLGVGVQAPTAEWGSMILSGKDNISTGQWWTVTFPGLAILVAVIGFNLLADGIEKHRDIYR